MVQLQYLQPIDLITKKKEKEIEKIFTCFDFSFSEVISPSSLCKQKKIDILKNYIFLCQFLC